MVKLWFFLPIKGLITSLAAWIRTEGYSVFIKPYSHWSNHKTFKYWTNERTVVMKNPGYWRKQWCWVKKPMFRNVPSGHVSLSQIEQDGHWPCWLWQYLHCTVRTIVAECGLPTSLLAVHMYMPASCLCTFVMCTQDPPAQGVPCSTLLLSFKQGLYYSPFHKTLPISSLQIHWISVRFYEMDDRPRRYNKNLRKFGSFQ